MASEWYDVASVEHFWVRRRFEVLRRLAGKLISGARDLCEIGCGNGLVQRQIEDHYEKKVTGFDLNEYALKRNVSRLSPVCCYDIHDEDPTLRGKFDLIFLFDVLEHIADEGGFLAAISYHLGPGSNLIVNVPAGKWAYSAYDRVAGHIRRYSIGSLREAAEQSGFQLSTWTYWGLPLVPTLMLRNMLSARKRDPSDIISAGFDSRTPSLNRLLLLLSQCEFIPQKFAGSSLMAVLRNGHIR